MLEARYGVLNAIELQNTTALVPLSRVISVNKGMIRAASVLILV